MGTDLDDWHSGERLRSTVQTIAKYDSGSTCSNGRNYITLRYKRIRSGLFAFFS